MLFCIVIKVLKSKTLREKIQNLEFKVRKVGISLKHLYVVTG